MSEDSEQHAGPATPRPQHSPGPWVYDPERGEVVSFAVSGRYIVAETVTRRNGPAIAAAPDLLAAAHRLQEFVDRVWGHGWNLSDEALTELDAILEVFPPAIAKAEGLEP